MTDHGRTVFAANGRLEAQQVQAFLEAQGIEAVLRGESLSATHGLTIDGLGRVEVIVDDADEEQALALLKSAAAGEFRLADDVEIQ